MTKFWDFEEVTLSQKLEKRILRDIHLKVAKTSKTKLQKSPENRLTLPKNSEGDLLLVFYSLQFI